MVNRHRFAGAADSSTALVHLGSLSMFPSPVSAAQLLTAAQQQKTSSGAAQRQTLPSFHSVAKFFWPQLSLDDQGLKALTASEMEEDK